MPPPTCKKQVLSFIGMVNYISKFSVRLSELAEPIRELSKDKVPFNWGPEHQAAFKQMEKEIVRIPILAYYNPKKETILQTNASIKRLGACLLQDQKVVYFASKTLTEAQQGYVAIEIESLAVSWAMEKSHHFFVCKPFHSRDQSETIGSHLIQKPKPSTTKATKNFDQNISIQLYCSLHTRCDQSACKLLVMNGRPKRLY